MPMFKMQMIFNLGKNGWSEAFHTEQTTPALAIAAAADVANKRGLCLAANCVVDGIRLSRTDLRGSTQPVAVNTVTGIGSSGQPDPQEGLLWSLRFSSGLAGDEASVYRRNYIMRGHGIFAVAPNPVFGSSPNHYTGTQATGQRISGGYVKDFEDYFAALKAGGFGDLVNKKSTVPSVITSAGKDADNNVLFTCSAPHGLVVGNEVVIAGLKRAWKPFNGTQVVVANKVADNTKFTVVATESKPAPTGVFFPPAFAQKKVQVIAGLLDWHFLRTVSRETGKAFFVTAGRSKKRAITY